MSDQPVDPMIAYMLGLPPYDTGMGPVFNQAQLGGMMAYPPTDATYSQQANLLDDYTNLMFDAPFIGQAGAQAFAPGAFDPTISQEPVDSPNFQSFTGYLRNEATFEGAIASEIVNGGSAASAIGRLRQMYDDNPDAPELQQLVGLLEPLGPGEFDPEGRPSDAFNWDTATNMALRIQDTYLTMPATERALLPQVIDPSLAGQTIPTEDGELSVGVGPDGTPMIMRTTVTPSELGGKYAELGLSPPTQQYTYQDFLPQSWQTQEENYRDVIEPGVIEAMQRYQQMAPQEMGAEQLAGEGRPYIGTAEPDQGYDWNQELPANIARASAASEAMAPLFRGANTLMESLGATAGEIAPDSLGNPALAATMGTNPGLALLGGAADLLGGLFGRRPAEGNEPAPTPQPGVTDDQQSDGGNMLGGLWNSLTGAFSSSGGGVTDVGAGGTQLQARPSALMGPKTPETALMSAAMARRLLTNEEPGPPPLEDAFIEGDELYSVQPGAQPGAPDYRAMTEAYLAGGGGRSVTDQGDFARWNPDVPVTGAQVPQRSQGIPSPGYAYGPSAPAPQPPYVYGPGYAHMGPDLGPPAPGTTLQQFPGGEDLYSVQPGGGVTEPPPQLPASAQDFSPPGTAPYYSGNQPDTDLMLQILGLQQRSAFPPDADVGPRYHFPYNATGSLPISPPDADVGPRYHFPYNATGSLPIRTGEEPRYESPEQTTRRGISGKPTPTRPGSESVIWTGQSRQGAYDARRAEYIEAAREANRRKREIFGADYGSAVARTMMAREQGITPYINQMMARRMAAMAMGQPSSGYAPGY